MTSMHLDILRGTRGTEPSACEPVTRNRPREGSVPRVPRRSSNGRPRAGAARCGRAAQRPPAAATPRGAPGAAAPNASGTSSPRIVRWKLREPRRSIRIIRLATRSRTTVTLIARRDGSARKDYAWARRASAPRLLRGAFLHSVKWLDTSFTIWPKINTYNCVKLNLATNRGPVLTKERLYWNAVENVRTVVLGTCRSVKSEAEPAVAQLLIRADVHAPPPADVHAPRYCSTYSYGNYIFYFASPIYSCLFLLLRHCLWKWKYTLTTNMTCNYAS